MKYTIDAFSKYSNASVKELKRWKKFGFLIPEYEDYYSENDLLKLNNLRENFPNLLTRRKQPPYEDLVGKRFLKLLVLERADDFIDNNGHRSICWKCVCDCGEIVVLKGSGLLAGYNKSCGCLQNGDKDRRKMWNNFLEHDFNVGNERSQHNKKVGRPSVSLIGKTFGWLTVIDEEYKVLKNNSKVYYCNCVCRCGKHLTVKKYDLKNNRKVSCGCMPKDFKDKYYPIKITPNYNKLIDLTGMRFGHRTVISRAPSKYYDGGAIITMWNCVCDCGTKAVVASRYLRNGESHSCGCLNNKSFLEEDVYNILVEYGVQFEYQKSYIDLLGTGGRQLTYDFLIYKDNKPYCILECQGVQHFKPVSVFGGINSFLIDFIHDQLKYEYCVNTLCLPFYEITYKSKSLDDIFDALLVYKIID